jgi:glycosyltransferase involved in cell wall biosynthesis
MSSVAPTSVSGPAVRVFARLRTAHLERFRDMTPARVLYTETRYDFDDSMIDHANPPLRRSRVGVIRELLCCQPSVLEINEPTMVSEWPFLFTQVATVRMRGVFSRRRTAITAYCIGVTDPAVRLRQQWRLPPAIARRVARAVMATLVRSFDRLAFGTVGSLELYERYVGWPRIGNKSRLFEALPSACDCLAEPIESRTPTRLVFVGKLTARKGIQQVMDAWEVTRTDQAGATLHIIGKGELEREVVAWAADKPEVSIEIDPPRTAIHSALRQSGVLICLSQPNLVREQIGLPIVEGLSHGCEIVATSETGLARWLARHGHGVVEPGEGATGVANEVRAAFGRAATRHGSLSELPAEDQRIAADRWMMTGRAS